MSRYKTGGGYKWFTIIFGVLFCAIIVFLIVSACLAHAHDKATILDEWQSWGKQEKVIEDEQKPTGEEEIPTNVASAIDYQLETLHNEN